MSSSRPMCRRPCSICASWRATPATSPRTNTGRWFRPAALFRSSRFSPSSFSFPTMRRTSSSSVMRRSPSVRRFRSDRGSTATGTGAVIAFTTTAGPARPGASPVHRDANFNNFARRNDRITADRNFRRDDNRRFDNNRGFDNNRRGDRSLDNNRAFDNRRSDRNFNAPRDGRFRPDDRAARLRDRTPPAFQNNAPRDDRLRQGRDERAARLQEQRQRDFDNRSRGVQDNRGRGIENRSQFRDPRPQGAENRAPLLRENNRRQSDDNRRQPFENRSSQRLENQSRQHGAENRAFRGRDADRERPVNNRPQQEFRQNQRNERRAAAQSAPERGAT